jgi:hypothetical protein
MPRPRRSLPPLRADRANSVIASAARIAPRTATGVRTSTGAGELGWQAEAWDMFDEVGELASGAQWVSNALSRCILRLQYRNDDGDWVTDDEDTPPDTPLLAEARNSLTELFGGEDGQRDMLATFALHFTIPGETFLVGVSDDPAQPDQWLALSNDELIPEGNRWKIDRGDGEQRTYANAGDDGADTGPSAVVIRLWRPHPRRRYMATSPTRPAIPILRKLVSLNRYEGSTFDSRLAGNGVLLVPTEATFAAPDPRIQPADVTADPFMNMVIATMEAALTNPGSAAARAPITLRIPGDLIEKVQHITFEQKLSEHLTEREDAAIKRLALAMDLPPEALTGYADSNHWSAWLISEDAIKIHVEPLGGVLVSALVQEYLRPRLAPTGTTGAVSEAAARWRYTLDTSAIRQRPNRSADAQALWGNLLISDDAVRREAGFTDADIPGDDEIARRLLTRVAAGNPGPDLVSGALAGLGVEIVPDPAAAERVTAPAPEVIPLPPAPVEDPRNPPSPDQAAALLGMSELMVLRAVERAQNRVTGRRRGRPRAVPDDQMDACLRDAWQMAPRVAALTGVDEARLVRVCDGYTRTLLRTGVDHQPGELADMLRAHVMAADDAR